MKTFTEFMESIGRNPLYDHPEFAKLMKDNGGDEKAAEAQLQQMGKNPIPQVKPIQPKLQANNTNYDEHYNALVEQIANLLYEKYKSKLASGEINSEELEEYVDIVKEDILNAINNTLPTPMW